MPDQSSDLPRPPALHRRHALTGAAVVGLGLPVLSACGSGDEPSGGSARDPATGSPEPSGEGGGGAGGAGGGGDALAATSDIPVGGGTIFADQKVVVTQPSEGTFVAFSVTCTHQGCPVTEVSETINCSCHGSQFSIEDGAAVQGPATGALSEVEISVEGDQITLA